MKLNVTKKKIVLFIVSAELTVLTYFLFRGDFPGAFLIVSALTKEALRAEFSI